VEILKKVHMDRAILGGPTIQFCPPSVLQYRELYLLEIYRLRHSLWDCV